MVAAVARRFRDKQRGHAVEPVHVEPVPAPKVVPIDTSCQHQFVVMTAQELIRRRADAGWPAHYHRRLDKAMPHLVCVRCLRSYHRLRYFGAPLLDNFRSSNGNAPATTDARVASQVTG